MRVAARGLSQWISVEVGGADHAVATLLVRSHAAGPGQEACGYGAVDAPPKNPHETVAAPISGAGSTRRSGPSCSTGPRQLGVPGQGQGQQLI
jgi:hypothetical protein